MFEHFLPFGVSFQLLEILNFDALFRKVAILNLVHYAVANLTDFRNDYIAHGAVYVLGVAYTHHLQCYRFEVAIPCSHFGYRSQYVLQLWANGASAVAEKHYCQSAQCCGRYVRTAVGIGHVQASHRNLSTRVGVLQIAEHQGRNHAYGICLDIEFLAFSSHGVDSLHQMLQLFILERVRCPHIFEQSLDRFLLGLLTAISRILGTGRSQC